MDGRTGATTRQAGAELLGDASVVSNTRGEARMVDVLCHELARAEEADFAVSFVRYSGVSLLLDALRRFSARGGRARVLTTTYMGITQPGALDALAAIPGVRCRVHLAGFGSLAEGFHAKLYLFRSAARSSCWIGSSNLSKGGLDVNLEANMRHGDPAVVQLAQGLFDGLWSRPDVIDLALWSRDEYTRAFLTRSFQPVAGQARAIDASEGEGASAEASLTPNHAQHEALARLAAMRAAGATRAVVIAAPGVGKTILSALDARSTGARRVLFISHRHEHLTQAQSAFSRVFGATRSTGLVWGGALEHDRDLVFCSIQSAAKLLDAMRGGPAAMERFDYVVVDEFHHASAPSYRKLLAKLQPAFLLGLTATPERADGHDVLALCDFNVAYEVRLVEAIERGWLTPFHYFGIADETVDYDRLPWRNRRFDPEALEHALMVDARVDHILSHALTRGFDGTRRATVGFCAGVRHAEFMARALNQRGHVAASLTGKDTPAQRQEVFARFVDPRDPLEWLFVADLLNEGVDLPAINSLLFLRPTDSPTIFIQQLGRGLRLHPDCEVLTVLDFVGHHRNAWLAIQALHHPDAPPGPTTIEGLGITPPRHCTISLDEQTVAIMQKLRAHSQSRRDRCVEAYVQLREEFGEPPMPVDLFGREDTPSPGDFRGVFGSWRHARIQLGDAAPWERDLDDAHPLARLLAAAERDWQAQRVHSYALLWGLAAGESAEDGFARFFRRFPRWRVEHAALSSTKAWNAVRKNLGDALAGDTLHPDVWHAGATPAEILHHVEGRLRYTLEHSFQLRHNGVLRTPDALTIHRRYTRPEIIRHFGVQYDPARHNRGVMELAQPGQPDHFVLITKIDTSSAKAEYHYTNRLLTPETFTWQSQNSQHQHRGSGQRLVEHTARGVTIHLFAQPGAGKPAFYLGPVRVLDAQGDAPINVTFRLQRRASPLVCAALHMGR